MNMIRIRNTALAGAAVVAVASAGIMASPNEAQAGKKGAFVGGLVIGSMLGAAGAYHHYHGGPVYGGPVVYGAPYGGCALQKKKVWNPYHHHFEWKYVQVCY